MAALDAGQAHALVDALAGGGASGFQVVHAWEAQ